MAQGLYLREMAQPYSQQYSSSPTPRACTSPTASVSSIQPVGTEISMVNLQRDYSSLHNAIHLEMLCGQGSGDVHQVRVGVGSQ